MAKDELAVLGLFVALLVAILWFGRKRAPLGYRATESLMTPAELKFYRVLRQALPDSCLVFTKVRVADVMVPKSAKDRGRWRAAFNKVACKHFDYVVCDEGMRVLFAIELDDASHQKKERKERDRFLEWACESAGVELLRVPLRREYDRAALKKRLQRACKDGQKRP